MLPDDFHLFSVLLQVVLVIAAFYVTLVGGLYAWQRKIIFVTDTTAPDLARAGVPLAQEWRIVTEDGLDLVAWFTPPREAGQPVALFFHGNSGNIGHRADRMHHFEAAGWGALLVEYRGFGGNPGSPSEEGIARDARAALAALIGHGYPSNRIVIWGESLGTAVAVRLATENAAAALVLEAPFTSMADIARMRYRLVPIDPLLKDRFDSFGRIGSVEMPLLVMHGIQDDLIPIAMGARLFGAATTKDREFWSAPAAGHNDLAEHGAMEAGIAFVNRRIAGTQLAGR